VRRAYSLAFPAFFVFDGIYTISFQDKILANCQLPEYLFLLQRSCQDCHGLQCTRTVILRPFWSPAGSHLCLTEFLHLLGCRVLFQRRLECLHCSCGLKLDDEVVTVAVGLRLCSNLGTHSAPAAQSPISRSIKSTFVAPTATSVYKQTPGITQWARYWYSGSSPAIFDIRQNPKMYSVGKR